MNELIQRLVSEAGINEEQAQKAIMVIAEFTKEKFPMFEGAIDNLFKFEDTQNDPLG